MNMFSTKDEVDQHVKKLLSISKNQSDNDLQCQMIAKFYFDVKEYEISKSYIKRFIQIKDNNQNALRLKAKIHENLSEFDLASKEYEKLYDLFFDENDLNKACEYLCKGGNINDNKLKKFMTILEKNFPNNVNYWNLKKLSTNVVLNCSIDEIEKLKEQIKLNTNDDLKIRFLRIIEDQNGVIDSLKECVKLMNTYPIMDNIEAIKLCLSIFKKHFKQEDNYKPYYSLILISLLNNHSKICEYDRGMYLMDLLNLFKNDKLDGITKEIFGLFMFQLTSFVHCRLVKENKLTKESVKTILGGYLISNSIEVKGSNEFGAPLLKWISEQNSFMRSIAGHFIYSNFNTKENDFSKTSILRELSNIAWNSSNEISESLNDFTNKLLTRLPSMKISDIIFRDVQHLAQQFQNLKLVAWQMACYNGFENPFQYEVNEEFCMFVGELVRRLFQRLPTVVSNKRSPENISKTDIIVFLIGTFLTYQKSFKVDRDNSLLYPFDLWEEIRIPEVVHKWWQAACDFTLLNKRNTSIGALRDLLKSGLDSLQLMDNQMSEILKMQLAKLTLNCSMYFDSEKDALKSRAIAFYDSVLRPTNSTQSFKNLAMSTYSNQNCVTRQRSFTNLTGSFGGFKTKELFDTEHVADDVMDQWKFDAYLLIVDWQLTPSMMVGADFDELEQLMKCAEKLDATWPKLHLLKSRIYLSKAQSKKNQNYGPDEFNRLVKLSTDSAHEGLECLYVLNDAKRVEMHDLLQQQLNTLSCIKQPLDYSVFEFSRVRESSNSNKFLNQSALSNDFYNQSLISNDPSTFIDPFKFDQLQSEIANIGSSQDKIGFDIGFCMSQVDNLSQDFRNKLEIIQSENERQKQLQNDTYSGLIEKIDNLSRKTDRLEFQIKIDREEKDYLGKTVNNLTEAVNKLTIENALLKNEVKEFHLASKIVSKIINPEISKLNTAIDSNVQNMIVNMSKLETMKLLLPLYVQNNQSVACTNPKPEDSQSDVQTIDLKTYNDNKWECTGCYCMNDNNVTACPACSTAKPSKDLKIDSIKEEKKTTQPSFDLSKFNQNKWECPQCSCMNDNNLTKCPACQHNKVESKDSPKLIFSGKDEKKTTQPSFDLSKFNQNKWECPQCSCMNDNNLTKCPACQHNKIGSKDSSKLIFSGKDDKKTQPSFDLSKFNQNKWECPQCSCMNDNNLTQCPACQCNKVGSKDSVKPVISGKDEKKTQPSFDLSKFNQNKWQCPECYSMNDNTASKCPACSYTKTETKTQGGLKLPFEVSKTSSFVFGSQTNSNTVPTNKETSKVTPIQFGGSSTSNNVATPIIFAKPAETTSNSAIAFNPPKPTSSLSEVSKSAVTPIKFGSKTETNTSKSQFVFGLPKPSNALPTNSTTSNSTVAFGQMKKSDQNNWKCNCTTVNKPASTECIACGEPKNDTLKSDVKLNEKTTEKSKQNGSIDKEGDSDSDVIFVSEPYVTEEQKMRARALLLPDHFYYYENLPDKEGDNDSSSEQSYRVTNTENSFLDKAKEDKCLFGVKPSVLFNQPNKNDSSEKTDKTFSFGFNSDSAKSMFGNFNSGIRLSDTTVTSSDKKSDNEEENPEDFDPHYQPIIDLPDKIQVITGEEDSECLFKKKCKLFKFVNGAWNERGIGEMKILTSIKDGAKSSRLVMKREQVHKVCCNQSIMKTVPTFTPMNKTGACWFAKDFSDGNELVSENFAIRFKLEEDLQTFINQIKSLQAEM